MRIANERGSQAGAGRRAGSLRWALAALALAFGGSVLFLGGVAAHRGGWTERPARLLSLDPVRVARNWVTSFRAEPDRIVLDVAFEPFQKLAEWRRVALERGQITADLKEYVPARVGFRGTTVKAKLRLKGEWTDHVDTEKWSLRVKLKGDGRVLGMKRFSLQHPKTRDFVNEWVYHRALAREGVAVPRYGYVSVTMNGRDLGVYALEGAFSKQFIEANGRREGVIVRFDASHRYQPFATQPGVQPVSLDNGITSEHASELMVYDDDLTAAAPELERQASLALNLLEAFRAGQLAPDQVFDVDLLARYFAVSELMGTVSTADDWSDMRFLYNPMSSRLEPTGVEGAQYFPLRTLMGPKHLGPESDPASLHGLLFRDRSFFARYVAALERVSESSYVDGLVASLEPDLTEQLRILHREWPDRDFSRDLLDQNAASIRAMLEPAAGMQAYLEECSDDRCRLEVAAIQLMPVEVLELRGDAVYQPSGDAVIPGLVPSQPLARRVVDFKRATRPGSPAPVPENAANPGLPPWSLSYRLLGTSGYHTVSVIPHRRIDATAYEGDPSRATPNAETFPFLEMHASEGAIAIRPGRWTLDRTLVVPPGLTFRSGGGVHLDLVNGASIVSSSPLEWSGTEEHPIVVSASDGSGQGVFVTHTDRRSTLRHVSFQGLSNPRHLGWSLTGAVTFYRAPVALVDCEFMANHSEDSLNVVESPFTLERVFFEDSPSDAFDSDLSSGLIQDATFHDIQGDAVDLSGGSVRIANVEARDVGDKGLSAGEGTVVSGSGLRVQRAQIGIASKDLAHVRLESVTIEGTQTGLAAFQKKPEYGPATLNVSSTVLTGVPVPYELEPGSTLLLNWQRVSPTRDHLAELFYGKAPSVPDRAPPAPPDTDPDRRRLQADSR